jgi:LPXTG-motif cell wall-anchored protein
MHNKITQSFSRIMLPLSLGVTVLLLVALIAPGVALAHAELASSSPAAGETVAGGLTSITLNFSEEISPDQSTAKLMQADGTAMSGATSSVDRADRKKETLLSPPLTPGKYTVKWHSVTEDDNGITDGSFTFTVAAAGDPSIGTVQPLPATGGQETLFLAELAVGALLLTSLGLAFRRKAS